MYAADLEDLPFNQVINALVKLRRDPRTTRFPLPAKIREAVHPQESPQDAARIAANEIWEAIGRFGWPNGNYARAQVGTLAWEVVTRNGGWISICQASGEGNAGTFKAQLRDLAESLYKRSQAGKLNEKVNLPEPSNNIGQLPDASKLLRAMPDPDRA
jgi:hypothetical protein